MVFFSDFKKSYSSYTKDELLHFMKMRNLSLPFFTTKDNLIFELQKEDEKEMKQLQKTDKKNDKYQLRQGSQNMKHIQPILHIIAKKRIGRDEKKTNPFQTAKILKDIPGVSTEDPGKFPNNIEHIYWVYSESSYYDKSSSDMEEDEISDYDDEDTDSQWYCGTFDTFRLFCKLTNGNYAYLELSYCGSCCLDPLSPESSFISKFNLYVVKDYKDILEKAMDSLDYFLYTQKTKPIKSS